MEHLLVKKNTYTYWWYSKISDEKMKQLCIHASSYVRNYIKESRKTVATILEHKNLPNVRTVLNDKTKQTEFVRRSTKGCQKAITMKFTLII